MPLLVTRLGLEPDFFVRENLTWAIVRMGQQSLPYLLPLLEHPVAAVRLQAVHTLSKLAYPTVTQALGPLLADEDPEVVRKVIFTLGHLGNEDALEVLFTGLGRGDAEQRNTLSTAIEGFAARALPGLTGALQASDPAVRVHAAEILALIGLPDSVPALRDALKDSDWNVRFAALSALGQVNTPAARKALETVGAGDDPRLRTVAQRLMADRQQPSLSLKERLARRQASP